MSPQDDMLYFLYRQTQNPLLHTFRTEDLFHKHSISETFAPP